MRPWPYLIYQLPLEIPREQALHILAGLVLTLAKGQEISPDELWAEMAKMDEYQATLEAARISVEGHLN